MGFWQQRKPARVVAEQGVPITLVTTKDEVLQNLVIVSVMMAMDGHTVIVAEDRGHFLARLRVN